jgi:hypothetical protein
MRRDTSFTVVSVILLAILGVGLFLTTILITTASSYEHTQGANLDWKHNFYPWLLMALTLLATAASGFLVFGQFRKTNENLKLHSAEIEAMARGSIQIFLEIPDKKSWPDRLSRNDNKDSIEIAIHFINSSLYKQYIICEVFMVPDDMRERKIVLKDDEKNTDSDYRKLDFKQELEFAGIYKFQGHFNIPAYFPKFEEGINGFFLVVHYASKIRKEDRFVQDSELSNCWRINIKERYKVPLLDIPDDVLSHRALLPEPKQHTKE